MRATAISCVLWALITSVQPKLPTAAPLVPGHPFAAVWSAPTASCRRLEIPLDLAAFAAVTTSALEPDQFLITYYEPRLGRYPRIGAEAGEPYEGGVPQNGSLEGHLSKARRQIPETLSRDSPGLVVLDWEAWRPLWDRNWGSKAIYRRRSLELARTLNPSLPEEELLKLAKSQFEDAGRAFMEETLSLGQQLRPSRLWGFYLFPDCYNHGWEEPGYTGRCSPRTQGQNQQLMWLWEKSSALFPSAYISRSLGDSPLAKLYVRNRVQEAMRVSELPRRPHTVPVYVYSRPLFRDQPGTFLSQVSHCQSPVVPGPGLTLGPASGGPGQLAGRDRRSGGLRRGHVGLQQRLQLKGRVAGPSRWRRWVSLSLSISSHSQVPVV